MNIEVFDFFPELTTERLNLKSITVADELEIFEIINYDSSETKELTPMELIQALNKGYEEQITLNWGMFFKDELIGSCGYYRGFENDIGEIGFVMRKKHRRKGFMTEALKAIVSFGYDHLRINDITAFTKMDNEAAKGLLESIGFKQNELEKGYWKYTHLLNPVYE